MSQQEIIDFEIFLSDLKSGKFDENYLNEFFSEIKKQKQQLIQIIDSNNIQALKEKLNSLNEKNILFIFIFDKENNPMVESILKNKKDTFFYMYDFFTEIKNSAVFKHNPRCNILDILAVHNKETWILDILTRPVNPALYSSNHLKTIECMMKLFEEKIYPQEIKKNKKTINYYDNYSIYIIQNSLATISFEQFKSINVDLLKNFSNFRQNIHMKKFYDSKVGYDYIVDADKKIHYLKRQNILTDKEYFQELFIKKTISGTEDEVAKNNLQVIKNHINHDPKYLNPAFEYKEKTTVFFKYIFSRLKMRDGVRVFSMLDEAISSVNYNAVRILIEQGEIVNLKHIQHLMDISMSTKSSLNWFNTLNTLLPYLKEKDRTKTIENVLRKSAHCEIEMDASIKIVNLINENIPQSRLIQLIKKAEKESYNLYQYLPKEAKYILQSLVQYKDLSKIVIKTSELNPPKKKVLL